jgi:pyruvate dehydrogenase E1 component
MYGDAQEDCFYYLTLYNENYSMPPMPEGSEEGIVRGLYPYRRAAGERTHRAQLLGSGTMLRIAVLAQQILFEEHDVAADVWSATSYKLLREDALSAERWNRLHPEDRPRVPYVTEQLGGTEGPIVAVTDFMKSVPEQIARFTPQPFVSLGTDGYGLSDTREALRRHFEVDAAHLVVATLHALALQGDVKHEVVSQAIGRYKIDPEAVDPRLA